MEGIDLSEYIDEYLAELNEQLETLNNDLLVFEKNPNDEQMINEIFRIAHTIKGSAATMGFNEISVVAHAFEDLLGEIREGKLSATEGIIDSSFSAFDAIKRMAANIQSDDPETVETEDLVKELRAHLDVAQAPPPPAPAEEEIDVLNRLAGYEAETVPPTPPSIPREAGLPCPPGQTDFRIKMIFEPEMEMKSVRAFLVLNHLKETGEILSTTPSEEDIEADRFGSELQICVRTDKSRDEIENILLFGEAEAIDVSEMTASSPSSTAASSSPTAPGGKAVDAPSSEDILRQLLGAPPVDEAPDAVPPPPPIAPPPPRVAAAPPDPASRRAAAAPEAAAIPAPAVIPASAATSEAGLGKLLRVLSEEEKATVVECINQDLNVFELAIVFRNADPQCAVRAMTIYNYLSEISRVIRSLPASRDFEPDQFNGVLQLVIATEKEIEQLRELMLAEEIEKTYFTAISLDGLELVTLDTETPKKQTATPLRQAKITRARTEEQRMGMPTVRVTVDRLDYLMNLVGELVIRKTQLAQLFTKFDEDKKIEELHAGITELNANLSHITSDLQTGIMKVRMVQIGQVFYRFSRLVRDLSKNLGKQVEFLIEGAETELDKTVIDEIGDPLMHLIRNALDHGIESPEGRSKIGKPEKGILLLKAQHAGNHIIVEVADDGAGLHIDRIRRKALEKGVVAPEELASMDANEIYQLIFQPGFSTSEKVSNISGRGVGMDVVKESIERLSGDIQIKSEPNVGTSIQIKLPLTLAIIQGLLVRVGCEVFTIPLSTVKETVQLDELKEHVISGQRVVNFRDEVIPIIYLSEFFNIPPDPNDKRRRHFVVFAGVDDDRKVGLVVNHMIGRREIVIKSLDRRFCSVKGFAGATVLGDGTVSLILDIPVLVEESKRAFVNTSTGAVA